MPSTPDAAKTSHDPAEIHPTTSRETPHDQAGVGRGTSPGGTPTPADDATAGLPPLRPGPSVHGADEEGDDVERGASATERDAGTPDDRATTDGQHGEGEPRRA